MAFFLVIYSILNFFSYNSREVGYTLAKSFLQTIDSQLNIDYSQSNDNKIPTFYLPLPLGSYLPNDMLFFKINAVKDSLKVDVIFIINYFKYNSIRIKTRIEPRSFIIV